MHDPIEPDAKSAAGQPAILYVLPACAVLVVLVGLVGALVGLAEITITQGRPTATQIAMLGAVLVGGFGGGALLVGLASLIGAVQRTQEALARIEHATLAQLERVAAAAPTTSAAPAVAAGTSDPDALKAVRSLLEEIRDNVLLTDEERRTKRTRIEAMERRECFARVEQALHNGKFHIARQLLLEMERRIGGDEASRQLAERIEETAQQAEAEDVAAATRQCEDLMSLTSWDRAVATANELIDRHPNSLPAKQLLARVQRERQVHERELRTRLQLEIQRHSQQREWRAALAAARQLLLRFPDTIEAEAIRGQMETLEANAEIEERRDLEGQFKRLVERKRFGDALTLAHSIIERFPDSPQGKALRAQLPELERRSEVVAG